MSTEHENLQPQDTPFDDAKPKKRGKFWRALLLLILLAVIGGGAYATFTPHGQDVTKAVQLASKVAFSSPDDIFRETRSNHVNILLIGRDVNWVPVYKNGVNVWRKPEEKDNARSDTMIVLSLDRQRKTIRMVSLPRDAIVHLPENDYGVRRSKLNAAHAYGGPQMLIRTLNDELGLTIHHYAVIRFDGFKSLIDQVGGVWVNVDGALKRDRKTGKLYRGNMDYDDNWGMLHIHLKPGLQLLDGEKAHNYVRFRMDLEGDPGRIRRQQQVMRALAKKIMQSRIDEIPGLVKEVRRQFKTTLTDEQIGSIAAFARGLGKAEKIQPLTLFGGYSRRGSVILNKPKNEKLLKYIFGPTFNPDNFLDDSPYTESGDEIGMTNNTQPGAIDILRAAGIIKDGKEVATPLELEAPTRVEPSPRDSNEETSSTRSARRSRERSEERESRERESSRSRVASSDSSSLTVETESSASTRPRRELRVEDSGEPTVLGMESSPEPQVETSAESPLPVAEGATNSGDLQVEDSPVPQPEN